MPQISRARQRSAIVSLLTAVPQLTGGAYGYPPDPDDPALMGKAFATVGSFFSHMKPAGGTRTAPYERQDKTWMVNVVYRSRPLGAGDNTGRSAAVTAFDTVVDAVEQKLIQTSRLDDGSGTVLLALGYDFETAEDWPELSEDRTLMQAWIKVNAWTIQSA